MEGRILQRVSDRLRAGRIGHQVRGGRGEAGRQDETASRTALRRSLILTEDTR